MYVRKSSESDERQVQSIEDQIAILQGIAKTNGFEVIDIISESKSAKAPYSRPEFTKLIERINKGEAQGLLVWKIDRLSRNPVDSGTIQWLLQQEKIKGIYTIDRIYRPEDNALILSVESGMANQYIRDLEKNVKRGLQSKIAKGWKPGVAPPGYLNTIFENRGENYIIRDPKNFPLIRKAWSLMLTGKYSADYVREKLNSEWAYSSRKMKQKGGGPISRTGMYKVFNNIFYTGLFRYKDQIYQGKHEPMITVEEFDKVQFTLGRNGCPRYNKHEYAFTGLINCGECGKPLSATYKYKALIREGMVKTYILYYCITARKEPQKCSQRSYTNAEVINAEIETFLGRFSILGQFKTAIKIILDEKSQEQIEEVIAVDTSQEETLNGLKKQLENLRQLRLKDMLDDDEYLSDRRRIQSEIAILEHRMTIPEVPNQDTIKIVNEVFDFALNAHAQFLSGLPSKQHEVLATISRLNCTLKDKKLCFYKHDWLVILENGCNDLTKLLLPFEPEKTLTAQSPEGCFTILRPLVRAIVHSVRTPPTTSTNIRGPTSTNSDISN